MKREILVSRTGEILLQPIEKIRFLPAVEMTYQLGACPRIGLYVISTNSAVVAIGYYGEVCREKSKTEVFSMQ